MKTDAHSCGCNKAEQEKLLHSQPRSKNIIKRSGEIIKMIVPAVLFTLIPKCPVCLAGYVALSTGIGLSITTATYIRIALIILFILSMAYFIFKHIRRLIV